MHPRQFLWLWAIILSAFLWCFACCLVSLLRVRLCSLSLSPHAISCCQRNMLTAWPLQGASPALFSECPRACALPDHLSPSPPCMNSRSPCRALQTEASLITKLLRPLKKNTSTIEVSTFYPNQNVWKYILNSLAFFGS